MPTGVYKHKLHSKETKKKIGNSVRRKRKGQYEKGR